MFDVVTCCRCRRYTSARPRDSLIRLRTRVNGNRATRHGALRRRPGPVVSHHCSMTGAIRCISDPRHSHDCATRMGLRQSAAYGELARAATVVGGQRRRQYPSAPPQPLPGMRIRHPLQAVRAHALCLPTRFGNRPAGSRSPRDEPRAPARRRRAERNAAADRRSILGRPPA